MFKWFSGSLKVSLTMLGLATWSHDCAAQVLYAFSGVVTHVHDGDTIHVQDRNGRKHKIRLAYIDAPELNQAGGQASLRTLKGRVLHQIVVVEVFDIDRYRREVGRVLLNHQDINYWQIQQGNAWHYQRIAKNRQAPMDFQSYAQAQNHARFERLGLWQNKKAQAPWAFRYQDK